MPTIIPLRELNSPSKISKLCHETGEPVFVTKNGQADLVVLPSERYDELFRRAYPERAYYRQAIEMESMPSAAESAAFTDYIRSRDAKPVYSIAELKAVLKPIFQKHEVIRAVLFGSYVKGTANSQSDVDLMVESKLRGLAFYGLLGDVAAALRFPVDLIEKRQVEEGSEMEAEIEETGVVIYERKG